MLLLRGLMLLKASKEVLHTTIKTKHKLKQFGNIQFNQFLLE